VSGAVPGWLRAQLLCLCAALGGCAQIADLAIVGGTVVDGMGAAPRRADVLIRGDTIEYVGTAAGQRVNARTTIDARGKYVSPGFIDTHAHGDPLTERFHNFLLQGVTTVVLGQDGASPQDRDDGYGKRVALDMWRRANAGASDTGAGGVTLAQWMRSLDEHGADVNIAPLSGHGTNRTLAGVGTTPTPTEAGKQAMEEILRADLAGGAFGVSTGLEYVPGRYCGTGELVALARIVGEAGGVVMSHMRSEDDDKIAAAIDELLAQGEFARVNVSHLKIVFCKQAGQAQAVLEQMGRARRDCRRISADVYPYIAGYADLTLVYPPWAKQRAEWDDAARERRAELEECLFARVMKRNGPEAILISSGPYIGKTLAQVADELKLPFVKLIIDTFGFGGPDAAHRVMSQEVQDAFIVSPDVAISTDGGPSVRHPRSWGTYPKVLQDYVAGGSGLSLEQAVRKMSGLPTATLGLTDRGVLKAGAKADHVVFDIPNVVSRPTWTDPYQAPAGIDAVIVNGAIAARDGRASEGRFGRVLRRPTVARH
jgi:N-acyl-D-amino-acid deacylase